MWGVWDVLFPGVDGLGSWGEVESRGVEVRDGYFPESSLQGGCDF